METCKECGSTKWNAEETVIVQFTFNDEGRAEDPKPVESHGVDYSNVWCANCGAKRK